MKGIIFNLLEEAVTAAHGPDLWDDLLDAVRSDGAYSGVGQYDDDDFTRLIDAMSERVGQPRADVLRWFGVQSMPHLRAAYPAFFDRADLGAFLLGINDIVHAEVRKLHPDSNVPEFELDVPAAGSLRMRYRSPRRLCHLAEGFILGAAAEYRTRVDIEQTACMLLGARHCDLIVAIR